MQTITEATSILYLIIKYRFPFIASEIFNCEINQLLDRFFDTNLDKNNTSDTKKNTDDD